MESDGDDVQEHETVIIAAEDYEEDYNNSISGTHMTVVHAPQQLIGDVRRISPIMIQHARGKYYKQTYRHAWENMPDFKGWLREVLGEPTRAFCIYCQKTLHAHRLSLLKHTCTMRHQKAAQIHQARKNKENKFEVLVENATIQNENTEEAQNEEQMMSEENFLTEEIEDGEQEKEVGEPSGDNHVSADALQKAAAYQRQKMLLAAEGKVPISTHVIDTTRGLPLQGLQVSLYKLIDGRWTFINEGSTNADGRFWNFIESKDFSTGRYKMHFDVDRYFEARKQESIYPFVEIVFDCHNLMEHYHIPLLMSPFGYTTYRGH